LELDLVTSMTLAVATLPVVLGATGCFDVHSVDPGPWVIDDFEDGDLNPADRNFGPWNCYAGPPPNPCITGLDSGDQSTFSLALDFTLVNPASGSANAVFAGVQTGTAAAPEDFSRFSGMVFSGKVVPGVPALPNMTTFSVHLGCSTVPAEDGTTPGNLYVRQQFDATTDWQPVQLPIASFVSPFYLATHPQGGPAACLRRIDSIHFELEPQLPAGQSAMGRLDIDEVSFR
jgi:hypothetical protein